MQLLTHNEAQQSRARARAFAALTGFAWPRARVITPRGRDHSSTSAGALPIRQGIRGRAKDLDL